jgi:hypothetical protein
MDGMIIPTGGCEFVEQIENIAVGVKCDGLISGSSPESGKALL